MAERSSSIASIFTHTVLTGKSVNDVGVTIAASYTP